jgi:hypothetical protein
LCKGADILLVVVGHDTDLHVNSLPSKLYEYFSACRPILVIGPDNSEAAHMVLKINRGIAVSDSKPEQIVGAIKLLSQGLGVNGKLDLSIEAVSEFTSEAARQKISQFFSLIT